AAGADGARADHLAGEKPRVPGGLRDDRVPGVVHVAEIAARALLPVDPRDHLEAEIAELVGRDDDRPEARREVLALRRAEADLHLAALEVARRPVVHDREPADLAVLADDGRHLELVIELTGSVGIPDRLPGPVDRVRV